MTRALCWSLVGSSAAALTIGFAAAGIAWAAPSVRVDREAAVSVTLLGHEITTRWLIRPAEAPDIHVTNAGTLIIIDGARGSALNCVVVP